jgi:hypothetical protein
MQSDAVESAFHRPLFAAEAQHDVCVVRIGSRKDALATGTVPERNATQRRQPQHQSGTRSAARLSNPSNIMLLMRTML